MMPPTIRFVPKQTNSIAQILDINTRRDETIVQFIAHAQQLPAQVDTRSTSHISHPPIRHLDLRLHHLDPAQARIPLAEAVHVPVL